MSKTVYAGQTFLDKVVELTGSVENAFKMSLLNGISITDELTIGQSVVASPVTRKSVVSTFNDFNRPATDFNEAEVEQLFELPGGEFPISF